MKRICSLCKEEKDIEYFYKNKREKLGREYRCKICSHKKYKKYWKEKGHEWNEKTKLRQQEKIKEDPDYFKKLRIKYNVKDYQKKYKEKNKERDLFKLRARAIVNYDLKKGKIVKPDFCEMCKNICKLLHAHHEDYLKPREIKWMCPKCHKNYDNFRRGFECQPA